MKELNGAELADFIKERQAKAVRGLRQAWQITPKLAIISTHKDPVSDAYIRLKKAYASDILIEVEVYRIDQEMVPELLDDIGKDKSVHGAILQLPLADPGETDRLCALIPAGKDVDSLGPSSPYDAATPTAINWLLSGHGVDLRGKQIAIVGNGRLVGAPLAQIFATSDYAVEVYDETSPSLDGLAEKDVIISAAGSPGLIKASMVSPGAVVIDAGTATSGGEIQGDVAEDVRALADIKITPKTGGVGPLTVAALFENLITAARGSKGSLPEET